MPGGESQVKTRRALIICAIAVLALSIGGIYSVYAETQEDELTTDLEGCGFFAGRGWGTPFRRLMGTLTEEQRNELASEIRDLVSSKFEEWGGESRPSPSSRKSSAASYGLASRNSGRPAPRRRRSESTSPNSLRSGAWNYRRCPKTHADFNAEAVS